MAVAVQLADARGNFTLATTKAVVRLPGSAFVVDINNRKDTDTDRRLRRATLGLEGALFKWRTSVEVSLVQLFTMHSVVKADVRCSCTKGCLNKQCGCRKAGVHCNSSCHPSTGRCSNCAPAD